jgi:outer membrane receptor for ferrienterochelin and colicin
MSKTFTIALCIFAGIGLLFAGTTGKIAGNVVDKQTGEPLAGANVVILGTTMGAAVDIEGDFYIIAITPGTYSVEVSMIGYATTEVQGVVVSIDKTTRLSVELESTTLETEEIVVTAAREAVKHDVSHSEVSATKEQMDVVPVIRTVGEYMALQPGIQLEGDEEGREMLIRGGDQDQIGMVVDGLTMTNNIVGGPIDIINLSAIQEVSVIRGGFNAEYGNIRSGLFNVITKEGTQRTKGSADVRYTFPDQKHRGPNLYDWESYWVRPYVDPAVAWVGTQNGSWDEYTQNQYVTFKGWNAYVEEFNTDDNPDNDMTAEEARNLYIWQHALKGSEELGHPHPGDYGNDPDWLVDLSLNGPFPFISESLGNMRYFISYRYNSEQYTYPAQIPAVNTNSWMVKLNFDIGQNMKVGLETIQGTTETAGGTPASELDRGAYFPHVTSPLDLSNRVYGLTFDHVLNPSTYYNVRLSYINVETDQNKWRTLRNPAIIRNFGPVAVDEQPWGFLNDPGYVYAVADEAVIGGVGGAEINQNKINTINIKADLTSQVNKNNQVQVGIELIFDDMEIFVAEDGFDPTGNFINTWTETPYRIQGYVQDKLEFNDFIANLGLRFDYNQPGGVFYGADPYSKYFSRVFKFQLEESGIGTAAKSSFTVSPRIGVAHPITEKSKLFFNYGHFYDLAVSFNRFQINYGLQSSGITELGNPDLLPRKTIAYELGYEHDFADMYLLRLTGYYKDVSNQIGEVYYENFDASVNYASFSNDQFADIRGFEIELRKEWGHWVTGWINYTYMLTSNGLIGQETQFQDPRKQAFQSKRNPLDELEKPLPQPYASGNLRIMSPQGWGPDWGGIYWFDRLSINTLVNWNSGEYLTYPILTGDQVANNLQWKDWWSVDLRISKYFDVGTVQFDVFLDIINVFDLKYLSGGGFSGDNDFRDYIYSLHLPEYGKDRYQGDPRFTAGDDKVGDYRSADKPYINDPDVQHLAWNTPRIVILGLRIGF